jgi:hypothetical protein
LVIVADFDAISLAKTPLFRLDFSIDQTIVPAVNDFSFPSFPVSFIAFQPVVVLAFF